MLGRCLFLLKSLELFLLIWHFFEWMKLIRSKMRKIVDVCLIMVGKYKCFGLIFGNYRLFLGFGHFSHSIRFNKSDIKKSISLTFVHVIGFHNGPGLLTVIGKLTGPVITVHEEVEVLMEMVELDFQRMEIRMDLRKFLFGCGVCGVFWVASFLPEKLGFCWLFGTEMGEGFWERRGIGG